MDKAAQLEKKVTEKKVAFEAQAAEKRARREALKAAFFEARASMAAATHQRDMALAERQGNATAKRNKLLQATVHKANYEVKHAVAVATATKEKEAAAKAQASSSLEERMTAASLRRAEFRLDSPLGSPSKVKVSPGMKTSRERARIVAHLLNDEAVALELKRKRLCQAMDQALSARNARLEARVRRAATYKDKAERAKAALEARQASVEDLAHSIVEKSQAAEVRRIFHLKAGVHKKMGPCVLNFDSARSGTAPRALIERLSTTKTVCAEQLAEHEQAVASRRELVISRKLSKLSVGTKRVECARSRRAAALEARKAKLLVKKASVAQAVMDAMSRRTASARVAIERAAAAADKREAQRSAKLGVLSAKAHKRDLASSTQRTLLKRGSARSTKRAQAVAARRTAFDLATLARGKACAASLARAAERRGAVLAGRIARAKMSSLSRMMAVTLIAKGGVDVKLMVKIAPVEAKKTADGEAVSSVANLPVVGSGEEGAALATVQAFMRDKEARKTSVLEESPAPAAAEVAGRGFIVRIFRRIFGL